MPEYKDQMCRTVRLGEHPPQRIISLVPSITELLFDLGLESQVVACTKFCIHPSIKTNGLKKIGGTKNIDIQSVLDLNPDLVIGNKEENTIEDISRLQQHLPIWMSDVNTITDASSMIQQLGEITDTVAKADQIISEINKPIHHHGLEQMDVAYLIWNKPYMVAASDTFIDAMLKHAGFNNVFAEKSRYPETTVEELRELQPQLLMLSTEPYPFKQDHVDFFQTMLPNTRTIIADGTYFSWYGSRMVEAKKYFHSLRESVSKTGIIQ